MLRFMGLQRVGHDGVTELNRKFSNLLAPLSRHLSLKIYLAVLLGFLSLLLEVKLKLLNSNYPLMLSNLI